MFKYLSLVKTAKVALLAQFSKRVQELEIPNSGSLNFMDFTCQSRADWPFWDGLLHVRKLQPRVQKQQRGPEIPP